MKAKTLYAHLLCTCIGFKHLVACETVFRLFRLADDIVAFDEVAWVVAETENLWETCIFLEIIDMADVV